MFIEKEIWIKILCFKRVFLWLWIDYSHRVFYLVRANLNGIFDDVICTYLSPYVYMVLIIGCMRLVIIAESLTIDIDIKKNDTHWFECHLYYVLLWICLVAHFDNFLEYFDNIFSCGIIYFSIPNIIFIGC